MVGGHFVRDVTSRKILQSGYWWSTLFYDCMTYTIQYNMMFVKGQANQLAHFKCHSQPY